MIVISNVINKEKNVGKTSSFKVKLKLNNTAVKKAKIKGADKKALNELVKKLNNDLSQKEYTFEIAPINLAEAESVTISAKLKDNKLQVNGDGTLKGLKSIKVKYKARGAAKAKTYSYNAKKAAKQFSIIVTNAEEKNVTVNANTDGNFTGSLPVKIGK